MVAQYYSRITLSVEEARPDLKLKPYTPKVAPSSSAPKHAEVDVGVGVWGRPSAAVACGNAGVWPEIER